MTVAEARAHFARSLTPEPVRVRGIITFSNQRLGLAYIQDGSSGIGFDPRIGGDSLPLAGQTVEVEGYLGRRQGLVMLLKDREQFGAPKVTLVKEERETVQPLPFDLDRAAQMRIDGLLTRVSGVVRKVQVPPVEGAPMIVEISTPSGYAVARLPWREPQEVLHSWLNSPVYLNAVLVCRADPPMLSEGADALLLVSSHGDWTVQPNALQEAFSRPPVTSLAAIQATQRSTARQRIHVVGTVTGAKPNAWICLRTDDGSIEVSTRQMEIFVPGQRLSIACWPQMKEGRMVLQDGVCRDLGIGAVPQPVKLEQGFFHPGVQRELVEVTGTLLNHALPEGTPHLMLQFPNGLGCLLDWEAFLKEDDVEHLENGSQIRLTGLCHILSGEQLGAEGVHLSILPRSLADVEVLKGPSWWTTERLMVTVWGLLGIVGLVLPGALIFRWQLWRQAQRIREIEHQSVAEEERRRIAREFHDSLQQQLTSAALHLETLKGAVHAAPEMLPRLIDDTTAMLRHCQIEARHCIWDLRTENSDHTLAASIEAWLHGRMRQLPQSRIEFTCEGTEPALPEGVPFQLLRIAQEAVNNALTHASASQIHVRLQCGEAHLNLIIDDDGQGFDPHLLTHPKPGHFGLSGLRERTMKIGAQINVKTHPGRGTRVLVRLILPTLKHEALV